MVELQGFFVRKDDEKALAAIEKALKTSYDAATIDRMMGKLRRRPLLRWFVLSSLRDELEAAGKVDAQGQIDWEAIGDFLIKIAPIIFKLIELFIGLA